LAGAKSGPVKIWCAGCSTGEEAYSLAHVAQSVGVYVAVLATDVNPLAIAVARSGQLPARGPVRAQEDRGRRHRGAAARGVAAGRRALRGGERRSEPSLDGAAPGPYRQTRARAASGAGEVGSTGERAAALSGLIA
jgi:CheR methyltransferase, SAM binding domain